MPFSTRICPPPFNILHYIDVCNHSHLRLFSYVSLWNKFTFPKFTKSSNMPTLATYKTRFIKLILWRGSLILIVIFIRDSLSLRSIIIFKGSLFRLQLTISRKMIFEHIIIGWNKVYLYGGITIALLCHECILSSSLLLHTNACDQSLQGCLLLFVPHNIKLNTLQLGRLLVYIICVWDIRWISENNTI